MKFSGQPRWAASDAQRQTLRDLLREKNPHLPAVVDPTPAKRTRALAQPSLLPLERDIQRAIVDALAFLGWRTVRMNVTLASDSNGSKVQFGEPGMADLLVVKAGRVVWLEVKRPGEKPTDRQLRWHERMRLHAPVHVVQSVEDALQAVR